MVEISRDGKRVYFTNSLYGAIDQQFYPDGIEGWMVKLDAKPDGGIAFDEKFFVEWPSAASPAPGAAGRRRLLVGLLLLSVSAGGGAFLAEKSIGRWSDELAGSLSAQDAEQLRAFEREGHNAMAQGYSAFFAQVTALAIAPLLDAVAPHPRHAPAGRGDGARQRRRRSDQAGGAGPSASISRPAWSGWRDDGIRS